MVRAFPASDLPLIAAIRAGVARKPEAHEFGTACCPALAAAGRLMNLTGG